MSYRDLQGMAKSHELKASGSAAGLRERLAEFLGAQADASPAGSPMAMQSRWPHPPPFRWLALPSLFPGCRTD